MSVEADIASLKLIAAIHQTSHSDKLYDYTVHKLYSQVSHFEWVGLYLKGNETYRLVASAGDKISLPTKHHSIIQIKINDSEDGEIGRLTVTARKTYSHDETDYSALAVLVEEIGKRLTTVV